MSFCPNCGEKLNNIDKFCSKCGKGIDSKINLKKEKKIKSKPIPKINHSMTNVVQKKSYGVFWLIGLVLVIILVFYIFGQVTQTGPTCKTEYYTIKSASCDKEANCECTKKAIGFLWCTECSCSRQVCW